jgi:glycosyltransferase involved in cell wall biosynthesis
MRVAFISGCLEYSVCLANAMSKKCELDFFYSGAYARQRDDSILTLLDPAIGKLEINSYRLRDPRNFSSHRRLARLFNDYDVIHLQGSNFWFNINRQVCGNVPIVCTIHDPVQHTGLPLANRLFQSIAQRISVSQAAAFIVHGQKLRSTLAALHRIPKEAIEVIPHGEFSFYKKMRKPQDGQHTTARGGKRVLFFGEVRKNKGLEYLIKAEPLISAEFNDYHITIAGRFKQEAENNLAYYRGLMHNPDRFEIIDRFVANCEVADIFERCDIVVLPYVSASQSGVLPLAYGFGKPVVATEVGSIGEVLHHGRTGLIVPPADERALAAALLELLRDDDCRSTCGRNAQAVADEELSWDNIAERTLAVYQKVTAARQRKQAA